MPPNTCTAGCSRAGREIYEYQPQILHAKLIIMDDTVYVGSCNLDRRSLDINYELLLRMEWPELAALGRGLFEDSLDHSRAVPAATGTTAGAGGSGCARRRPTGCWHGSTRCWPAAGCVRCPEPFAGPDRASPAMAGRLGRGLAQYGQCRYCGLRALRRVEHERDAGDVGSWQRQRCSSGCGYNNIQSQDEAVKAAWSEVVNQYQRRADLVPNLVGTVKGYAAQEKSVLIGVTEARAKVGTIQATPELINDEAAFKKFQAAQGELTSALKSLIAVSENYPQLKSDQNFRDLQAQLEGTENRITVARNRYIDAVHAYNVTIRSFPSNLTAMIFKYQTKPNFTVENEAAIAKPPTVDFGTGAAPAPAPTGQ